MSEPIVITIPHRLGKEEAANRLKGGLAKVTSTLPMVSVEEGSWSGDTLSFRMSAMGQQAAGTVDVADTSIRVALTLPWMLQQFAEAIQSTIKSKGQILLEKK
ncbi:MAG: polyhydroxyalkanoic acid system family protein [Hyphomicrobium sp.]|uniref:polyhydroxyalkanoic acid system family protein n=1 Tax=Hyphomicrobium sp. TaxID=82 RepID=UPI003D1088B5